MARWTGQPPRFPSAPSPAGPHRCSGRPRAPSPPAGAPFRAWLSRHHGTVGQPAGLGSTALGPQTASACQDNAVLPYIRHYGRYCRHAGGCARRPENGPRDVRFGAHAPPIRVPRQGRDLLGRPGPVTMRRPRREHAFRRLASGAGRRLGGWGIHDPARTPGARRPPACAAAAILAPLIAVTAARPRSSCRCDSPRLVTCRHPTTKQRFPQRGGQHRASCGTLGEVTHSLWTAVEINYNRATAQPDRLEGVITASAFALTARDARRTPRHDAGDFGSRRRSRLRRTLPRQTRPDSDALIAQGDPSPDGPAGPARRCRG